MNDFPGESSAWLETLDSPPRQIRGSCSIGRAASNHVTLLSEKVSRRHALIQVQREKEFWLVDFGSRNGTYLNSQRIIQPSRLQDLDRIKIGPFEFVFPLAQSEQAASPGTIVRDITVTGIRLQ